jgi:outer membrane protein OmpA-like peptidoglycan-associated protein
MKRYRSEQQPRLRHIAQSASIVAVLAAVAGCGGTTAFRDQTPIRIAVAPPPPPAPEVPPPPKQVILRDNKIEITEKVQFEYNKANVLSVSFGLLDEVAKVIQENPHVQKVSIEGHASDEGDENYNLTLSKARAEAVRVYLVSKGVAADRLNSTGFGEAKPLVANDTPENREKNRRVEFNITKQELTAEAGSETSKEKVVGKSSKNEEN